MTEGCPRDDRRHRTHSGMDAPYWGMEAVTTSLPGRRERSRRAGGRRRGSTGTGRPSRGTEKRGSERVRGTASGPGARFRDLLPAPQLVLTLQLALTLQFAVGVATAHGGGTSDRSGHLVVDFIGFVAFAFLVYLGFLFVRDVLYRRLRDVWRR